MGFELETDTQLNQQAAFYTKPTHDTVAWLWLGQRTFCCSHQNGETSLSIRGLGKEWTGSEHRSPIRKVSLQNSPNDRTCTVSGNGETPTIKEKYRKKHQSAQGQFGPVTAYITQPTTFTFFLFVIALYHLVWRARDARDGCQYNFKCCLRLRRSAHFGDDHFMTRERRGMFEKKVWLLWFCWLNLGRGEEIGGPWKLGMSESHTGWSTKVEYGFSLRPTNERVVKIRLGVPWTFNEEWKWVFPLRQRYLS